MHQLWLLESLQVIRQHLRLCVRLLFRAILRIVENFDCYRGQKNTYVLGLDDNDGHPIRYKY
jgi:hypothetical protein